MNQPLTIRRSWLAVSGAGAGTAAIGVILAASGSDDVIAPVAALVIVLGVFLFVGWARHGGAAPLEIGTLYMLAVALYGTYPLLVYLVLGGVYTPLNDSRLYSIQPPPGDVARVGWLYVIYFASFASAYSLVVRNVDWKQPVKIVASDRAVIWAILVLFAAFRAATFVADLLFAAPAEDYLSQYLRYRHLPLLAQQLLGHANGIASVLAFAAIVVACQDWARWRWLVCGWLTCEFLALAFGLGARTQFVLLCLGLVISYHYLNRALSLNTAVLAGVVLLGAFLVFGAIRAYQASGLLGAGLETVASASEFESLFGNAVDIDRMLANGDLNSSGLGVITYLGDVIALIPQQLMPFEKSNLSGWYITTYYPEFAEAGGGLVFGAIPEALVGNGILDLIWRGIAVGLAFGWLDRSIRQHAISIWWFVFYVWVASSCYLTFRVSMLALLPPITYRFLPALVAVVVLAFLLRAAGTESSGAISPGKQ